MKTKYGKVRVKVGTMRNKQRRFAPEYDDCKALSMKTKKSVQEIYSEAIRVGEKDVKWTGFFVYVILLDRPTRCVIPGSEYR